jgi:hypothetical protein
MRYSYSQWSNSTERSPCWDDTCFRSQKFPAFYRAQSLITVFTRTRHWTLSWATRIQSSSLHPAPLRSILMLSCYPPFNDSRAVIAQSVKRWSTGWTIRVLGFDSQRGLGIFLFTTTSSTALGPTQPAIQWVPEALSLEVKRPVLEADHSPPSSAEVNNAWSYTYTPPIRNTHGVLS